MVVVKQGSSGDDPRPRGAEADFRVDCADKGALASRLQGVVGRRRRDQEEESRGANAHRNCECAIEAA